MVKLLLTLAVLMQIYPYCENWCVEIYQNGIYPEVAKLIFLEDSEEREASQRYDMFYMIVF